MPAAVPHLRIIGKLCGYLRKPVSKLSSRFQTVCLRTILAILQRVAARWFVRRLPASAQGMLFGAAAVLAAAAVCGVSAFESLVDAARETAKDAARSPHAPRAHVHALYPRTDGLLARVRELAQSCDEATLGRVAGGGSGADEEVLEYVTLTRRKGYLKEHFLKRRTRALFVFGEAGREAFVTSQVALRVLESVCGGGGGGGSGDGDGGEGDSLATTAARVLAFSEIILVPLVNAAGRRQAEAGGWCEVGNARDVDLNRNFPEFWSPTQPPEEDQKRTLDPYPRREVRGLSAITPTKSVAGDSPFSEWETRALRSIVQERAPTVYVSVQSGYGVAISPPGDCSRKDAPRGVEGTRLAAISDRIVAEHCSTCSHASFVDATGRGRCGTGVDWAFKQMRSRSFVGRGDVGRGGSGGDAAGDVGSARLAFAYTWRIYANRAASPLDCARAFNPLTKPVLESVVRRWASAVFSLVDVVHDFRVDARELGAERALANCSRAAAVAMARRLPGARMTLDEAEAAGTVPDADIGSHGAAGAHKRWSGLASSLSHGARADSERTPAGLSTALLALALVTACVGCLFAARKYVFTPRGKPFRARTRAGYGQRLPPAPATMAGNMFRGLYSRHRP